LRYAATTVLVLLLAGFLAAGVALPAHAQMETMMGSTMSETLTLPAGEYKAYGVSLYNGEMFRFSARVAAGGPVDVYLFNATNYADYQDPMKLMFGYVHAGTQEDTMSFSSSVRAPGADTYYLVIDNAAISSSGAMGTGTSTVQVSAQTGETVDSGLIVVAAVVVVCVAVGSILIVLSVRRQRRKAAAVPPPPTWPGAPGPVPPQQPPIPPPGSPPGYPPLPPSPPRT